MIVVGGGVAGLTAAVELARAGKAVLVLEARQRLGGRICTGFGKHGGPVELGAEFVHGKSPELWDLIRRARVSTEEVPDLHRVWKKGSLAEMNGLWKDFSKLVDRINLTKPDCAFADYLRRQSGISPAARRLALDYVEGFDAADAGKMSAHALARESKASDRIDGDRAFRVATGYHEIVLQLERQLETEQVSVFDGRVVESIDWQPGWVRVHCHRGEVFQAEYAIVTVPVGVLKSGAIAFRPEVPGMEQRLGAVEMGHVVKLNLEFRSRIWPEENFGFIHSADALLPTWWSHPRGHLLTAWVGGPRASKITQLSEEQIEDAVVDVVSRLFDIDRVRVRRKLISVHSHDWSADAFARGAYSYITTGGVESQRKWAEPVGQTLFFAGEATALDSQLGTVHGALKSGIRAARQIQSLKSEVRK